MVINQRATQPPHPRAQNGDRPSAPAAEAQRARERPPLTDSQSMVLVDAVRHAARVGLLVRTALFAVAIVAALMATLYTIRRGDEMVTTILDRDRGSDVLWERVVSLTLPVLLLVLLGAVCVAGAHVLQSRALDERERALDAIARIRRESEAGVSRVRTLARLAEDDLTHARREFAMQIAFGRASWWLAASLVGMAAVYSIGADDLDAYSVGFSAGGVGAYLLGVVFKVPDMVRCNLSALSQRHLIVSGYAREVGLIEAEAYRLIGQARKHEAAAGPRVGAEAAAQEIRAATGRAVARIEKHCKGEPPQRART